MSGRAIILIVSGIIVIASIILYRIEAASTAIVANSAGYYKKQLAANVAQGGINLALTKLGSNRNYRTGGWTLAMLTGKVTITVFDTTYPGIDSSVVGIRSIASSPETTVTSVAVGYFPPALTPVSLKALITLKAQNQINGNITLDARDHDTSGALIAGNGTWGVWTTGSSFNIGGSAQIGGTVLGVDFPPSALSPNPSVLLNAPPAGYPGTPDSVLGGKSKGYPDGTLKAIAQSGVGGSQYVTDPNTLRYPLSGVTYVEAASGSPWQPASLTGSGILVVHNSTKNAQLKNTQGQFTGILIADDIVHLHGNLIGAIIGLTSSPSGNVLGNGNASILFSRQAILLATSFLTNGNKFKVIAWWE